MFGHDLVALFGESTARRLPETVPLLVFSGTNVNPSVPFAHWVLPTAAHVETEGTFVNCEGRVQRISRALPPCGNAREDWRVLLDLAELLGLKIAGRGPAEIFNQLAEESTAFAGLSYEALGAYGAEVATTGPGAARP